MRVSFSLRGCSGSSHGRVVSRLTRWIDGVIAAEAGAEGKSRMESVCTTGGLSTWTPPPEWRVDSPLLPDRSTTSTWSDSSLDVFNDPIDFFKAVGFI